MVVQYTPVMSKEKLCLEGGEGFIIQSTISEGLILSDVSSQRAGYVS